MKTPEQKYLDILKERRSQQRWRYAALIGAIFLSVVIVFASHSTAASLLGLVGIWVGGFCFFYLSRHADVLVAYFRTIHRFLRENDATLESHPTVPEQSDLTQDEASAFDDLVNRLKNS